MICSNFGVTTGDITIGQRTVNEPASILEFLKKNRTNGAAEMTCANELGKTVLSYRDTNGDLIFDYTDIIYYSTGRIFNSLIFKKFIF